MSHLWQWVQRQQERPIPLGTEALDITEWLEFFWMHPQEMWDFRDDLPNIAPPFRSYFMFGQQPNTARIGDEVRSFPKGVRHGRLGVLFRSKRRKDNKGWEVYAEMCGGEPGGCCWALGPILGWAWRVNDEGHFVAATDEAEVTRRGPMIVLGEHLGTVPEEVMNAQLLLVPFLLATSAMHCKNVTARRVLLPRQMRRQAKREGRPLYSYSVLDVAPVKRLLSGEGRAGAEGLARALHICRGHFKDYRDGKGLFGQYKGLFWWDQTLRGEGPAIHDKTYRVRGSE